MITPKEFLDKWGADTFVRANAESLESLNMPVFSKRFLIEAGLPRNGAFCLDFDFSSDKLPTLAEVVEKKRQYRLPTLSEIIQGYTQPVRVRVPQKPLPAGFNNYWPIGHDGFLGFYICLDSQGQVMSVNPSDDQTAYCTHSYFFSSSVPQLAESLLVLRDFWTEHEEFLLGMHEQWPWPSQKELDGVAESLERGISAIDAEALNHEHSWWSAFTDEIRSPQ